MAEKVRRASWSGKWAFILAAAASAVGLGNLWRFPYLAANYGGGIFLLTYLVLVFTFGISLLLLETALGRKTEQSTIGAFKKFGKKYAFIGIFTSAIPFIITPYYCVIGGWVAKYMFGSVTHGAASLADSEGVFFTNFITGGVESFLWMYLFMAVVFFVVARGVKGGIEKANLIMMPALLIMAVILAVYTLTMPGALEGAAYYLVPDFSKFSLELVVAALGQMFFSLSLAMGIMFTYGSYLKHDASLTQGVTRIGGFDVGVSFLAGLVIVPAAFVAFGSGDAVAGNSGPSLMFIVLPTVFSDMGAAANFISFLFFLLVFFAAATSAISLTETLVSIVIDSTRCSRKKALLIVFGFIFVMGSFINAGYNILAFVEPLGPGSSILDFLDFLANSVMMPIAALMTCIFVGWIIKPKTVIDEVRRSSSFRLAKPWSIMIKYIAPVLIVVIMVSFIAAQFGVTIF